MRLGRLWHCVSESWLGALVCCRPEVMKPQVPTWRMRPGCIFHVSSRFHVCGCVSVSKPERMFSWQAEDSADSDGEVM